MGLVLAGPASAALIFHPEDFSTLGVTGDATTLMTSHFDWGGTGTFKGNILSQAFNLSDGNYLYVYQAQNAGSHVMETLVVEPFYGLQSAGYLTANEPLGFLSNGLAPAGGSYIQSPGTSPYVSFAYPDYLGNSVPPGGHSTSLYLISPNAPVVGVAHVIDSGTADVPVWMAPEPATLCLLGAAGLAALMRRQVGRRR
jgi:hypothetical protein